MFYSMFLLFCLGWDISTDQFPVQEALLDIYKQDSNNSRKKGGSEAHCSAVPYEYTLQCKVDVLL